MTSKSSTLGSSLKSPLKSTNTKSSTTKSSGGASNNLGATATITATTTSVNNSSSDSDQPLVFRTPTRAKKIFKSFDLDQDKFLTRQEFEEGLRSFITAPDLPPLTQEQIDALWLETDLNVDGKISWAEFNFRFCGGPDPRNDAKAGGVQEKKLTLHLQTPRKPGDAGSTSTSSASKTSAILAEYQTVLESLYDGPKMRYSKDKIDLTKVKQMNSAALKKLISSILTEEKAEAKTKNRPIEAWASGLLTSGVEQKYVDKLFAQFDEKRTGKVDMSGFFEQLKLRPSGSKGDKKDGGASSSATAAAAKLKKKKKDFLSSGPQSYLLTTVKPENIRDFVSESLLKHISHNLPLMSGIKSHPPLKHWGDDETKKRGLLSEGYKVQIFLSERTKIKAVVKLAPQAVNKDANGDGLASGERSPRSVRNVSSPTAAASAAATAASSAPSTTVPIDPTVNHSDILIFAAFRTEYTSMARYESLYHARIVMDEYETIKGVEVKEKKNWVDGEIDKSLSDAAFEDWSVFVGAEDEFEEMSIPPIV